MNIQVRHALGLISGPASNRAGLQAMRFAIAVIFLWIGALKFAPYEADSITPFVANSPMMSFFYAHPDQYAQHLTHEGELNLVQRSWQAANHTYAFSRGLGTVELLIGVLVLVGLVSRRLGLAGAVLAFLTPVVTLSFLVTTPEAWVPALGDAQHGFPYLSGGGRLVLKDVTLMAGAWLVLADSARAALEHAGQSLRGAPRTSHRGVRHKAGSAVASAASGRRSSRRRPPPVAPARQCRTTGCGRRAMPPIGHDSGASLIPTHLVRRPHVRIPTRPPPSPPRRGRRPRLLGPVPGRRAAVPVGDQLTPRPRRPAETARRS